MKYRIKFLISLGVLIIILLAVEASLTVNDHITGYLNDRDEPTAVPDLSSQLKPQHARIHDGILYLHNSMGFRDIERVPATNNKPRILVVGDSIVYGVHSVIGKRFSDLLQAQLPNYEVWNMGVPGYSANDYVALAEYWQPRLKPSIIIIALDLNDLEYSKYYKDFGNGKHEIAFTNPSTDNWTLPFPLNIALYIYRNSHTLKIIVQATGIRNFIDGNPELKPMEIKKLRSLYANSVVEDLMRYSKVNNVPISSITDFSQRSLKLELWQPVINDLVDLHKTLTTNNIKLYVVMLPLSYQCIPALANPLPNSMLLNELFKHNIQVINPLPKLMLSNDFIDRYYAPIPGRNSIDCYHFSDLGQHILTEDILKNLAL